VFGLGQSQTVGQVSSPATKSLRRWPFDWCGKFIYEPIKSLKQEKTGWRERSLPIHGPLVGRLSRLDGALGVDNLMWGSDYPHTEGVWSYSRKKVASNFPVAAHHVVHGICWL